MEDKHGVELILSDVFLPNEDGLLILRTIALQQDIPVVMMSWSGETGIVMKYIANGACDFLIKPVRMKELNNIWQHVFRKQMGDHIKDGFRFDLNMITTSCSRKRFSNYLPSMQETDEVIDNVRDLKRARLHWTRQLHLQFVDAVNTLGLDNAFPKKILEIMKVQHLTREHVASHLQLQMKTSIETQSIVFQKPTTLVQHRRGDMEGSLPKKYKLYLKKLSTSTSGNGVESSTIHVNVPHQSTTEIDPSTLVSSQQFRTMDTREYNYCEGHISKGSHYTGEGPNSLLSEVFQELNGFLPQQDHEPTYISNCRLR